VFLVAAIVELGGQKNHISFLQLAIRQIHQVLLSEGFFVFKIAQELFIHESVQISSLHSFDDCLGFFETRIGTFLDPLDYEVSEVKVLLRVVEILQELELLVSRDEDVLVHEIDLLGCLVVVDGSEVLESLLENHVDDVDSLHVIGDLVVEDFGAGEDDLVVGVVLVALQLVQSAVEVVATQVV
jgi:hypothetical protein